MSENISAAISVNGEIVMKQPLIKSMRVVKKETLKLISDWVSRTNDHQMVRLFVSGIFPKNPQIYFFILPHIVDIKYAYYDFSVYQVLENFIPPLLDAVLLDYQKTNVHCAREPEVLSAMATIVNKLEAHITSEVPKIFDAVFECTLEMINKDFEEFPEHRTNFFLLLQVSVSIYIFFFIYDSTYILKLYHFIIFPLGGKCPLFPCISFNSAGPV